ncbi:hypothetical protein D3C84_1058100 [compost metagenome]
MGAGDLLVRNGAVEMPQMQLSRDPTSRGLFKRRCCAIHTARVLQRLHGKRGRSLMYQ